MAQVTCSIEGCEKRARGRGWCGTHYMRWRTHGDPMFVTPRPRNICTAEGCHKYVSAHGLCANHASQAHRRQVRATPPTAADFDRAASRFWSRVDKSDTCWAWTGRLNNKGYGEFSFRRVNVLAHRLAYEMVVGPIPDGLVACHHCDNPPCVNPEHLFIGTQLDNIADRDAKGRQNNARKTHCPQGHPYSGDNLIVKNLKVGVNRVCRICRIESDRRRRARKAN